MAKSPDDEYSEGLEEQIKQLTEDNARLQTIIHHASQMENLDRLERDRLRDALQNLEISSSVSRANFQIGMLPTKHLKSNQRQQ